MDILNWIYLKKHNLIKNFTESGSLIAIGNPYNHRDDKYLTTAILVDDLIGAQQVTFDELTNLINTNKLIAGKKYVITDYQTVYDQPDFDSSGNAKSIVSTLIGVVEPLIVTAVSVNKISSRVYSTLYPNDIIEYDINFTNTEVMNAPAKGRITLRIDDNKNTTNYDSRKVLFKRYETSLGSGVFTVVNDNGFASDSAIPTFQVNSWNNNLENFYTTDSLAIQDFILPNNIFGEYTYDNKFGNYFINNTFGSFTYDNEINEECYNNIVGEQFFKNIIGNRLVFGSMNIDEN